MPPVAAPHSLPPTPKTVCIYCGSSAHISAAYAEHAATLARALVHAGFRLVYGGGQVGLMGVVANAALDAGGYVIGIIPEYIRVHELQHLGLSELHVVESMHTRKRMMMDRSDAFVILPGGFGTLDEMFEVLTWKQLGLHRKTVVIDNEDGFWTPLLGLIDHLARENFAPRATSLFRVATSLLEILEALRAPQDPAFDPAVKWS